MRDTAWFDKLTMSGARKARIELFPRRVSVTLIDSAAWKGLSK
jgi:hypothetical protein